MGERRFKSVGIQTQDAAEFLESQCVSSRTSGVNELFIARAELSK
jgi:hypothetical protein